MITNCNSTSFNSALNITNHYYIIKCDNQGITLSVQEYPTVEEAVDALETKYWEIAEEAIEKSYESKIESIGRWEYNAMIQFLRETTSIEIPYDDYDSTPEEYRILYTGMYFSAYQRSIYQSWSPKVQFESGKTVNITDYTNSCGYYLTNSTELLNKPKELTSEMAIEMLKNWGYVIQISKIRGLSWVKISADDDLLDAFDLPVQEYFNLCKSNPEFSYKYYSSDEPNYEEQEDGTTVLADVPWSEDAILVEEGDPRDHSFELYKNGEWVLTLKLRTEDILPLFNFHPDSEFTQNLINQYLLNVE